MSPLHRKLRAVRRRLMWLRFARVTLLSLFWCAALAALVFIASRLVMFGEDEALWQYGAWITVGALIALAIPAGLIGMLLGRQSLFRTALEADQQLSLRERLSSAVLLRGERKPMEELLEADATVAAERIRPRRDFPFAMPALARWTPLPLIALAIAALVMDQHNLLARDDDSVLTPEERRQMEIVQEDNQDRAEELEDLAALIEEATTDLDDAEEWDQMRRELTEIAERLQEPDASRIEQLAELSDLTDRMAERRAEMERQFAESRNFAADPSATMTEAIQEAMEEGDTEAVQQAVEDLMEELAEQMESGELEAEDLEQLAQELEAMTEQMGGDQSQTGQSVAQAAQAMQAAAAAMQQSEGAGDNQAVQAQMAQAMQQAQSAMAQAAADMADAQQQLSIAEALEADLNAARACMACRPGEGQQEQRGVGRGARPGAGRGEGEGEGRGAGAGQGNRWRLSMATGRWGAGPTEGRRGSGTGGPGQGMGGRPPEDDPGETSFEDEQLQGAHTPGVIIAQFEHRDGVQVPGESNIEISDAFLSYEQTAEHTLETEVIPAGYRTIAREYFEAIHPVQVRPTDESGGESEAP
ncbi:hypothetical protein JXA47_05925 [Candidatus Sumerlaeota bacterium]|nr:hypothetical protein [Candidatus Sumerlaeota bacterium]